MIILVSDVGPQFDVGFDGVKPIGDLPKRSDGYIELLTNLLLVEHFLKRRFYTVRMIKIYKAFMPLFLNSYKQVVDIILPLSLSLPNMSVTRSICCEIGS